MFVNNVPCAETYRAITRPAILDSIKQTLKFYHIDPSNFQIYFNGEAEISKLFGSDLNDKKGSDQITDFKNRDKLYVLAEVNDNDFNSGYSNNYRQDTHMSFWKDPITETAISPMFVGRRVEVEINRHFRTRQEAVTFKNAIERIRTQQMANFTFDATVHLPINTSLVELFKEVYTRLVNAKAIDPNTINFSKWLVTNAKHSITVISNLIGNNKILVSPMRVENIEVIPSEPNVSKVTKGDYLGRFEVSFSYYFYWQEFIGWQATYPIMVYQQLMPEKYFNPVVENWKRPVTLTGFLERTQMMELTKGNKGYLTTPYYDRIPLEDPWAPPAEEYMVPKLQVTLQLSLEPTQTLFNLKDIDGFEWNKFYIDYLLANRKDIFRKYNNPLTIKLFSNDVQVDPKDLSMDENGNIIFARLPTIKNIHRAVLFVNYDIKLWSEVCIEGLLKDKVAGKKLLDYIMPWLNTPEDYDRIWIDKVMGVPNPRPPFYEMAIGLRAFKE